MALIPVPTIALFALMSRLGKMPRINPWKMAITAAYFIVATILDLPSEWILGGACLGGGIFLAFLPTKMISPKWKYPILARLTMITSGALLGCISAAPQLFFKDQVTLGEANTTFTQLGRTATIPRGDLEVDAMKGPHHFWSGRPWMSWTFFSGEGKTRQLGPDFTGFMLYWGPHGLIRGDDLARHVARWAHVTPRLGVMTSSSFVYQPLPGWDRSSRAE